MFLKTRGDLERWVRLKLKSYNLSRAHHNMSVHPNTWVEPFPTISQTNVKDIWAESTDEIHKDLYMKLSTQAAEITALTNLCEKFKSQIDEMSLLKGDIGAEVISLKGDIGCEMITLKGDIGCEMITLKGDINCEVNSLKAEIETLKQASAEAEAIAEKQTTDKEFAEELTSIVNAGLVPLDERLKSLENKIHLQSSYTSFKRLQEEMVKIKEEMNPVTSVKIDMGLLGLEGRAEMAGIKAEMVKMKSDITKQLLDVKTEISSLLTGDFYIHAGGSQHGGILPNCDNRICSVVLSQDHMINRFARYNVDSDGTVKHHNGNDPLRQRWSFERATDKLIRHPDGSLISIPLDKSKVPV
jgi:hypothetical protein